MKKLLGKISSRKFIVEVIATIGWLARKMTAKEWIIVSCIYIGGNVLRSLVELLKEKKEIIDG